jgi:hypothetical protein
VSSAYASCATNLLTSPREPFPARRAGNERRMTEVPSDAPPSTEVPAPAPPEQPQPEPPDAPQPDPKGPETPDED